MSSLIPDAAAFERRLAGLPLAKHPAGQVVLASGSKTGRLLFLRSGAVEVIKDGEKIANVTPPLGENTPGRRSDWFLRVLRGYRGGDHT